MTRFATKISRRSIAQLLLGATLLIPAISALAIPSVVDFGPKNSQRNVHQIYLKFNQEMAALGDTTAPDAASVSCVGTDETPKGRWVDGYQWVAEFKDNLTDGVICKVTPNTLTTLKGDALKALPAWQFDTGGARVLDVLSLNVSWNQVVEDPYTLFKISTPIDREAFKHLRCSINYKDVPVSVVDVDKNLELLARFWKKRNDAVPISSQLKQYVLAQCGAEKWPHAAYIDWTWDKDIATVEGLKNIEDASFAVKVRPAFTYQIICRQMTGMKGCDPRFPLTFKFSADLSKATLQTPVSVRTQSGKKYEILLTQTKKNYWDVAASYELQQKFDEGDVLTIDVPTVYEDIEGRHLANDAVGKPVESVRIEMGRLPTYLGMADSQGTLEWQPGHTTFLPLIVRKTEKDIHVKSWRFDTSPQGIPALIALRNMVENWRNLKPSELLNHPFAVSDRVLASYTGPAPMLTEHTIKTQAGALEVLGVPMSGYGFWMSEADSPAYRAHLDALITADGSSDNIYRRESSERMTFSQLSNLNVNARMANDATSLIWVTAIDTAKPVANAEVGIWSCEGKLLATAKTDASGRADIAPFSVPDTCQDYPREPGAVHKIWIVVRNQQDVAMQRAHGYNDPVKNVDLDAHMILDRVLYRRGDNVLIQHIVRMPSASGWTIPPNFKGKLIIKSPDYQSVELGVIADKDGMALSSWKIPDDAKLGQYYLELVGSKGDEIGSEKFQVEDFRVPLFDASLTNKTEWNEANQTLTLHAGLAFANGGAVDGKSILLKGSYSNSVIGLKQGFSFNDIEQSWVLPPEFQQALSLNKVGKTDYSFTLPRLSQSVSLHAEMQFSDPNGETKTQSLDATLWPSRTKLGIKVDASMQVHTADITVLALDAENKPLRNKLVTIDVARTNSDIGFELNALRKSIQFSKRLPVCHTETNVNGEAHCQYVLDAKEKFSTWLFRVQAADASTASALAFNSTFESQNLSEVVQLLGKTMPYVGQHVRLKVTPPFLPATALLTVEREGVFDSAVYSFTKKAEEISLFIKKNYAPGVNVNIQFLQGSGQAANGKFKSISKSLDLPLDAKTHELTVKIVPSTKIALPGQTVQAKIKISQKFDRSNVGGAKVSLVVFDDALEKLKPNRSFQVLQHFWRMRFTSIYGVGTHLIDQSMIGKVGGVQPGSEGDITDLKKIWPIDSLVDWSVGPAYVTVSGIRKGVEAAISVKQNNSSIVEAISAEDIGRLPGMKVAESLARIPMAMPQNAPEPKIRSNFASLALWKTDITLDEKGEATVDIPLKDSLTRWRIVAIAMDGTDRFGYGTAFVQTRQTIQVLSGLPQTVRSQDVLQQKITVRNAGDKAISLNLSAAAKLSNDGVALANTPPLNKAEEQGLAFKKTIMLNAGENRVVEWPLTVPDGVTQIDWHIVAQADKGNRANSTNRTNSAQAIGDALDIKQTVVPAAPILVRDATMLQLDGASSVALVIPKGAVPNTIGVKLQWKASLVDVAISGARDWMRIYPYACFEQRSSKAVVSGDPAQWAALMVDLPKYLGSDGLVRYFPDMSGSELLTAYVLDMAASYQLAIPKGDKAKMVQALQHALTKDTLHDWAPADYRLNVRLALQAAIAPDLGGVQAIIPLDLNTLPTISLIDWVRYVLTTPDTPLRQTRLDAAASQLSSHFELSGTRLSWRGDHGANYWWMMWTPEVATARTALLLQQWQKIDPRWQGDAPRMIQALADAQKDGSWRTTTGNAWSVAAMQHFAKQSESVAVSGTSIASIGEQVQERTWPQANAMQFVLPDATPRAVLNLKHQGTGAPWLTVQVSAAVKTTTPIAHGVSVVKTITPVEQRVPGIWSEGDVMKITLELTSQSDLSWVVVQDPIPSGATILGKGLGGESQLAIDKAKLGAHWWWRPGFEEKANDSYRGYYQRVWQGTWQTEYLVRLNNVGHFSFPSTRIEAMYAPEIFGESPNAVLDVKP